jgi:hypothetical protein
VEECVVSISVTVTLAALLLGSVDIGVSMAGRREARSGVGSRRGRSLGGSNTNGIGVDRGLGDRGRERRKVLEDVLGVKELGVNVLGSEEVLADDEDLSRDGTCKVSLVMVVRR